MAFYPENSPRSFRATELAKEMGRQGHKIEILTKKRDFDYSEFESNYSCKVTSELLIKRNSPDIFKTERNLVKRIKDRFLYQLFLYPDIEISRAIVTYFKDKSKNYDLCISIAKPHTVHFGCAIVLRRNKDLAKTWVADCGDPFTLCKSDVYKFPFYFRWLEKWMFKRADYITIPVKSAEDAYYEEFIPKIRIIPQGFNFSEVKLSDDPINNPYPIFCYAGALYRKTRNPQKLLDYLVTLNLEFKFIVYTGSFELLEPYTNKLGKKLEIRPPIQRDLLLFELSKMDFLINIDNVHKEQVPSKTIDYALTKRPILSVEPENPDYGNILRFLKGDYSERLDLDNISDYNISVIAKKFIELIE